MITARTIEVGDFGVRIVTGMKNGHAVRELMDKLDKKNVRYHREGTEGAFVITVDADDFARFTKEMR